MFWIGVFKLFPVVFVASFWFAVFQVALCSFHLFLVIFGCLKKFKVVFLFFFRFVFWWCGIVICCFRLCLRMY